MKHSALRHALALHVAHHALQHETDLAVVMKATARLRRIAPEQPMLPALDAKIARMRVVSGLLSHALASTGELPSPAGDDEG